MMPDTLDETQQARISADRRNDQQAATNRRFTIAAMLLAAVSVISVFPVLIDFWRCLLPDGENAFTLMGDALTYWCLAFLHGVTFTIVETVRWLA